MRDNPDVVKAIRDLEKEKEKIDQRIKYLRENAEIEMYRRVEDMQSRVERYLKNSGGIYYREDIQGTMIVIPFTVTHGNGTKSLHYLKLGWTISKLETKSLLNSRLGRHTIDAKIHNIPYSTIDGNTIVRLRNSIFRSTIKWKSRKPNLEMRIRLKICGELMVNNWRNGLPKHHEDTLTDLVASIFKDVVEKQQKLESIASKFGI